MEWLAKLCELGTPRLAGIALSGVAVLFAPPPIARAFFLDQVRAQHGPWIGGITVLAGAFCVVALVTGGIEAWRQSGKRTADECAEREAGQEYVQRELQILDGDEWAVLVRSLQEGKPHFQLPSDHRLAGLLASRGMLVHGSPTSRPGFSNFFISPALWGFLLSPEGRTLWEHRLRDPHFQERVEWVSRECDPGHYAFFPPRVRDDDPTGK